MEVNFVFKFYQFKKMWINDETCFQNNPLILSEPIFKGTSVYWRSYKYAICLCSNIIRGPLSCRLIHLHLIIMVLPSFISLLNLLIVFSLATVLIMGDSLPDRENIFLLVRCIFNFFLYSQSVQKFESDLFKTFCQRISGLGTAALWVGWAREVTRLGGRIKK